MKIRTMTGLLLGTVLFCGVVALAQGPGPRGGGPGGFGGGFGGGRGMGILGSPHVVTGAPYSATEVLTIQDKFADGNSVNRTTKTGLARDSQGRTWVNQTVTPPASAAKAPYSRITISDPVAGYRYDLDSSTMIARQSRIPKATAASTTMTTPGTNLPALPSTITRPDGATITTTSLGTSTINGVAATGTQITEVIPAGAIGNAQAITITRITWVSTLLKLPVQIKSSDPRSGTSDMELTGISTGEPSASLFLVPAGYTIQQFGPGGPRGATGASGHGRGGGAVGNRMPGGRGPGGPGGPGAFRRPGGPPTGGVPPSQQ